MKISLLLLALVAGIAAHINDGISDSPRQDVKELADLDQELEDFFLEDDDDDEEEDDFDEEEEDEDQVSLVRFLPFFEGLTGGVCAGKAKGICSKQGGECVTAPFGDNCKAIHGDAGKLKKRACRSKDCQCCAPPPACSGKIKKSCSKNGGHCVLKPFKSNCKGGTLNKKACKSKHCQCCFPAPTTPAPTPAPTTPAPTTPAPTAPAPTTPAPPTPAPTTPAPTPAPPTPAPTTPAPTTPAPKTTSGGGGGIEDTPCDWPTGQQFWPHPSNCKMFVQCSPAGPQEMDCPPGTAWSQSLLTCVHETKANCDNGGANNKTPSPKPATTAAAPPTPEKTTPPPKTTAPPPPPTTTPPKPTTLKPTTLPPPTTGRPTTQPPPPTTLPPVPTTQAVPEGGLLPSIRIRNEYIEWKQNSFFGVGGSKSQNYTLVLARGPWPEEEFVYIQNSYPQDELINVCDLQYSSYEANGQKGVFFVYHDKTQEPYAKRFGLKANGIDQQILDAINENTDSITFPGTTSGSSFFDFNWLMGDNLKDVDC